MATTLQQLRDIAYGILREEEDTSAYPLILIDQFINAAELRICNGKVVNPINKEVVKSSQLPFLNKDKFYTNVSPTTLSADIVAWDTTITVTSTTDFPSTGSIFVQGNVITYTGKWATTFTGCTNVLWDFISGSEVSIVYTLPTDYWSAINLIYDNKYMVPPKLYDDIYEDLNRYKWYNYNSQSYPYDNTRTVKPFYTIKDNQYLLIYQLNDNKPLKLRYKKLPTEMSISTDTCTIPKDLYAKGTIPYLAVGEMLYNRWEEARAAEIFNFVCWQIKEMYSYYNDTMYQDPSGKQYFSAKPPRPLNI